MNSNFNFLFITLFYLFLYGCSSEEDVVVNQEINETVVEDVIVKGPSGELACELFE